MNLDRSDCEIINDSGPVRPSSALRDVVDVLKYIRRISIPQSVPPPDFLPPVGEAPAAGIDDIEQRFDPAEPRHSYTFVHDEEVFEMDIPDRATVGDTKQFVAKKFKTFAENVKLLHCGKELKDVLVLSKQRIRLPNRIIVYVRDMSSIILQSFGTGWLRTAEKPLDYLEQVQRLAEELDQDPRICVRAFTYFNYGSTFKTDHPKLISVDFECKKVIVRLTTMSHGSKK
jgi:hypothetical protein